jgi:predicted site-specific integrase-resolvase
MKRSTLAKRRALAVAGKSRFMRVKDYANRIGISERALRDWLYRGIIPYIKIQGHLILIDPSKADAALERFEQKEVQA